MQTVLSVISTALPYMGVEAIYTDKELANQVLEVPEVLGWTANAASTYISAMGFDYEVIGEGTVVRSQSPAAGSLVEPANGKIILYVGRDTPAVMVTVPDLSGLTAVSANAKLANLGLNIRIKGTNNYLSGTGALAISQYMH